MQPELKIIRTVSKTTRTVVTLQYEEWTRILREAVNAPSNAKLYAEESFGDLFSGPIAIDWTEPEKLP
mgnify:CR=1 FL=1